MFSNIGGKIKGLAKAVFWIGLIFSVLLGLAGGVPGVLVIGIIGGILSWLATFLFYGLGQLIENTDKIVHNQNQIIEMLKKEDL